MKITIMEADGNCDYPNEWKNTMIKTEYKKNTMIKATETYDYENAWNNL